MSLTKVTSNVINDVDASKLTGSIADARFPATLPAASGVNLTALNASNLGSGTVPTARLGSGTASSSTFLRGDSTYAEAGGGKVLQVLQNVKTDTQSISGNTFTTVLTQAITPAATSSKVLIHVSINVAGSVRYAAVQLYRDSTQIYMGDAAGSRARVSVGSMMNESASSASSVLFNSNFTFLDSPSSSSEVIYYVKAANTYTGGAYGTGATTYINQMAADSDADYTARGASSLTVQEIGA